MPVAVTPEWWKIALYAAVAALVLFGLFRIPKVGAVIRGAFSIALLGVFIFVLLRQAPFEPALAGIADRLGLSGQAVAGREVRIRMSPDGHFWAAATINGVPRRMLIDSGATVTALSQDTADAAGVKPELRVMPMMLRTANGTVQAQTATIDRLDLGAPTITTARGSMSAGEAAIAARGLKAVISPALGPVDILGMNFLSQMESWRVEGRVLILTPKAPASPT